MFEPCVAHYRPVAQLDQGARLRTARLPVQIRPGLLSACGRIRYCARFGSVRLWVQIPPRRLVLGLFRAQLFELLQAKLEQSLLIGCLRW